MQSLVSLNLRDEQKTSLYKRMILSERSIFSDLPFAVRRAVIHQDAETVRVLLKFYEDHLCRPLQNDYNIWTSRAIEDQNLEVVQLLLNFKPGDSTMVIANTLAHVCQTNAPIIDATLDTLDITDINAGNIASLPLFIAIRSGNYTAIDVMLQRGADINIRMLPNNSFPAQETRLTPLDVAIDWKRQDVIRYLLAHGANMPAIAKWPANRDTYLTLPDWMMSQQG